MTNPDKTIKSEGKIEEKSWLTYRTFNDYTLQVLSWELHQSAHSSYFDSFLCLAKSDHPSFPPEAEGQNINLVFISKEERATGSGLVEAMVSVPWHDQRVYLISGTLTKFKVKKLDEKKKNVF